LRNISWHERKGIVGSKEGAFVRDDKRFVYCDAQGVVFNARYADFVDITVNEYIRTLFGDYQNMLAQDLDIQVVGLTVNWKAPAKFDDVLDVLEAWLIPGRIAADGTLHHRGEPSVQMADPAFIAD